MKTLAVILSKIVNILVKYFKLGAGYTLPGYVGLYVYPSLFRDSGLEIPNGYVFITGTNGKTTTTKLISHIFKKSGLNVVTNSSGSNLLNGIATSILLNTDFRGRLKADIGVFEVDEFILPSLISLIEPKVLVLLNLSRDQLDRYGETDIILDRWIEAVSKLNKRSILVVDKTQEKFVKLTDVFKGEVSYFDDSLEFSKSINLMGIFNIKNINAAVKVGSSFGITKEDSFDYLKDFEAAYGRGELLDSEGKNFRLYLSKNPTSLNHNLSMLNNKNIEYDTLLFILNDDVRDGRDVSWIYDVNPEKLSEACLGKNIYVSGSRYLDFTVRLKYAGVLVKEQNITTNINNIVKIMKQNSELKNIIALPNYSAMLDLRKVLIGRQIL